MPLQFSGENCFADPHQNCETKYQGLVGHRKAGQRTMLIVADSQIGLRQRECVGYGTVLFVPERKFEFVSGTKIAVPCPPTEEGKGDEESRHRCGFELHKAVCGRT